MLRATRMITIFQRALTTDFWWKEIIYRLNAMITKNRGKKQDSGKIHLFLKAFFLFFFLVLAAFLLSANWQMRFRRLELGDRLDSLKTEIMALEKENQTLRTGQPSENEAFLEEQARERFQLKRPGESVLVVVSPKTGVTVNPTEPPKSWWQKILEKLGL